MHAIFKKERINERRKAKHNCLFYNGCRCVDVCCVDGGGGVNKKEIIEKLQDELTAARKCYSQADSWNLGSTDYDFDICEGLRRAIEVIENIHEAKDQDTSPVCFCKKHGISLKYNDCFNILGFPVCHLCYERFISQNVGYMKLK